MVIERVLQCRHEKIFKVNFMSKFGSCSGHVKHNLQGLLCINLVACVLWNLSCKSVDVMFGIWLVYVRKLLNISYKTRSSNLPLLWNIFSLQIQLQRRFVNFFNSMIQRLNTVVHCAKCLLLIVVGHTCIYNQSII